jgi:hypothetical protein
MSKEDQDYIDQNHPNRRQDIGEIDNLLDTYNRVYGTKAKLALDFEHFELIIDNVWINSVNGISRKVLKPLKLHFFNYDPGDEYMRFDFDLII